MKLEDIYFFAQIVAGTAVVISLVYLGSQIKRSRIQAENDAIDSITTARAGILKILAENSELSFIIPKGLSSRSSLTPNEMFRFNSYLYVLFVMIEIGFIKWKRKDINNELWKAWDEAVNWWLRFPNVRLWWQHNMIGGFTGEFNEYVNKIIEGNGNENTEAFEKQLSFMEAAGNNSAQEKYQSPTSSP
jgi:hypothetical protein